MKGVMRFGRKKKLRPSYVGQYDLQRVGEVVYKLGMLAELASFHPVFYVFMLKKCLGYQTLNVLVEGIGLDEDLS